MVSVAAPSLIRSKMRCFSPCTGDGTQGVEAACTVAHFEKSTFISIVIPFLGNPRYPILSAVIEIPSKQPELFAFMQDFIKLGRPAKDAEKARF